MILQSFLVGAPDPFPGEEELLWEKGEEKAAGKRGGTFLFGRSSPENGRERDACTGKDGEGCFFCFGDSNGDTRDPVF